MPEQEIGFVEHWFGHIMVAAIKVTNGPLKVGDTIHIKGHTSEVKTTVTSMQYEHKTIDVAENGTSVGIKIPDHVRQHDKVFKVT